jgi:hypothetical protein
MRGLLLVRIWTVAVVGMLALVSSGLGSVKSSSTIGALPSKLVGRWSRNISQADWRRYGESFPVGVWSFVVAKNGSVGVYYPRTTYVDFTTEFAVSNARLTIDSIPICATKGRYQWKVAGRSLAIKEVADPKCRPRAALFAGVWKRK